MISFECRHGKSYGELAQVGNKKQVRQRVGLQPDLLTAGPLGVRRTASSA
jgi:hypothetical protein